MRVVVVLGCLLFAAASVQAQTEQAPTCRADRRGEDLVTRIEYPDGYTVEGPWRMRSHPEAGSVKIVIAVLDRIVETQPLSHKQQTTALPGPIEMTFQGRSFDEVLMQAAHVWCMTVMQARPPWDSGDAPLAAKTQAKIML